MARTVLAPCKINLGLHVLRQRDDGFRDIDTVFLRIPWCDEVLYEPADDRSMTCNDPELPVDEGNLCMQAGLALASAIGREDGFRLHLEKRVPYGAGLGSGSSDAAATLRVLGEAWSVPPSRLREIAPSLGSDVPFFLGASVARGTGRGEILQPFDWSLPYPLVVAVPPVHVPTGEAYAMVEPRGEARPDIEDVLRSNNPVLWRRHLVNDFQEPVMERWPEIRQALEILWYEGALHAAMSGSGSAVFGICDTEDHAAQTARHLREEGCRTWWGFAG